jgi:DNA/RNA endonuclease YhcR with UshA esterase domain
LIRQYEGSPEIIVRDPWQIEVALTLGQEADCDCGTSVAVQVVTATPPATGESAEEVTGVTQTPPATTTVVINWQKAAAFVGQTVTVEGRVVDTYNSGQVVFLNFDEDYRHTFKVVIFPNAWPLFPQPPEDLYRGRMVRVTGQVKLYQGAPEIVVETPGAIEIME